MGKALFNVIFKVINSLVNVILRPINLLVVALFPDFSNLINTFNTILDTYIGGTLGFFSYLIPPTTKGFILMYLGVLVSYYTVTITVHAILKIIEIIKKVKIW